MNLEDAIEDLKDLSIKAGLAILDVYNSDNFQVQDKEDKSPLTAADLASHKVIVEGLEVLNNKLGENIPILSEESAKEGYEVRKDWNRFWLVDPLDGTKEFIKRNGEFTVNIALIEDQSPVLGFVYVPVKDELYYGLTKDQKAVKLENAGTANPEIINLNPQASENLVRIVASKSHLNEDTKKVIDAITDKYPENSFLSAGSSLKLCLVAEGQADFYPRYAPTMEWDTAAADAVCRAAGCTVMDAGLHKALIYNKENQLNPYFYVTSSDRIQNILESL